MRMINLAGQRFGRLLALEPTEKRSGSHVVWRCVCDCGNEVFVSMRSLKSRNTKSCGCLAREISTTHGMTGSPIYTVWNNMIQRCENPKNKKYKWYGGRGIKVCKRWHKFENFYEDVGDPPEGMTLDRWPSNDGDYEPTNWRWATHHEQRVNSRPISNGPTKQRHFLAFNLSTNEIFECDNQNKFAKEHGLSRSKIGECLSKKYKQTKGWTFDSLT